MIDWLCWILFWIGFAGLHCPIMFFWPNTPCCSKCSHCQSGTIPSAAYQIDIDGYTNLDCTECDSLNATYIITDLSLLAQLGPGLEWCWGRVSLPSTLCASESWYGYDMVELQLGTIVWPYQTSRAGFQPPGAGVEDFLDYWEEDYVSGFLDCRPNAELYDDYFDDASTPSSVCDASAATCTVTAIGLC